MVALACAVALVSCGGGGGGGGGSIPSGSGGPHTTAPATLSLIIPIVGTSSAQRRPRFTSPGTLSATISANGTVVRSVDLSPSGAGCTQSKTARTCAVTVDVPIGPITIMVSTYDGPLANGQVTGTLLGQAQVKQTIVDGPNPIAITLLGVPKNVVLSLDRTTLPVGTPATAQLTAKVYDPDGYLITSDPYNTPVTVAIDDTSGNVTLDKTDLTSPTDAIVVHYTGKLLHKPVTFSVTSPVQSFPPGSIATLVADPFTRFGPTTYPLIHAIAAGPDGNVWFTECGVVAGAKCKLGKIVPSTGAMTEYADVTYAQGLVAGPDGNVWFTEANHNFIGRITPSGVVTEFPIPSGAPANGDAAGPIVVGPDRNIWFAEGDRIGVSTTSGAISEYPIGGLFRPTSIVVGTDGALWFGEIGQIGRITTAGAVTQFQVATTVFSAVGPIVFGPSNRMYFNYDEPGSNGRIWSMTTSGTIDRTGLNPPGTSFLPALGVGPDGNMWGNSFTSEVLSYNQMLEVASLSFGGAFSTYIVPLPQPFGSTVGITNPAFGPDGNLWFVDGQGLVRFRIAL
jgi:streptogramin lyase